MLSLLVKQPHQKCISVMITTMPNWKFIGLKLQNPNVLLGFIKKKIVEPTFLFLFICAIIMGFYVLVPLKSNF